MPVTRSQCDTLRKYGAGQRVLDEGGGGVLGHVRETRRPLVDTTQERRNLLICARWWGRDP